MEFIRPRRFYLISFPRSGSNLLLKILGLQQQPNVVSGPGGGYFFMPTALLGTKFNTWAKPISSWTAEQRIAMMESYQNGFNELQDQVDKAAAQGKLLFVNEHSEFLASPIAHTRFLAGGQQNVVTGTEQSWKVQLPLNSVCAGIGEEITENPHESSLNETVIPESFLYTFFPTFIIRHPALAFPSDYRAFRDWRGLEAAKGGSGILAVRMTLHWTRTLYEFYAQHFYKLESQLESASGHNSATKDDAKWPLVLDCDDIMTSAPVLTRFCALTGLDPAKLQFKWLVAGEEDMVEGDLMSRLSLSTPSASKGVTDRRTAGDALDIDVEAAAWRQEFGVQEAERVEAWVRAAMPDYEFLKARRLRA